ncbi:MAG: glyoxalase [Nitrososphaera sp.]|nr:glyoxalase [Nitrososphaera sp.]
MAKVKPIPKGYHTLTPALSVRDADKAIEFYKQAFGAKERARYYMPDNKTIMHAELKIGDSILTLNDEMPEMKCFSPQSIGGTAVALYTYVPNVDKVFEKAVAAGATSTMPVMDAFWGDRCGQLIDPFGHVWFLATRKKNLTTKQLKKGQEEWLAQMSKQ